MSLAQGSDAVLDQKFGYPAYNRLKNHFPGAAEPSDLQNGMIWFDTGAQAWFGKRAAGLFNFTLTPPAFPEGMIIPWVGGYFTNGANGEYTRVLGASNDPAGINALFNSSGWYVCDGASLNIPESTIYNGPGRYLPNLTDDRFLMGDLAVGAVGGSNSSAHTHDVGSFVNAAEAAHTHGAGSYVNAAEASHTHGPGSFSTNNAGAHVHSTNPPATSSGGPSVTIEVPIGTGANWTLPRQDHTHSTNIAAFDSGSDGTHYHNIYTGTSGAGSSHNHAISGSSAAGSSHNHAISGASGAASNAENRPAFLGIMYLQYVFAS